MFSPPLPQEYYNDHPLRPPHPVIQLLISTFLLMTPDAFFSRMMRIKLLVQTEFLQSYLDAVHPISSSLSDCFNKSWRTGGMPTEWEIPDIKPSEGWSIACIESHRTLYIQSTNRECTA